METPMMFIINGRKYRLVTGDNITGRQYKMMLATLEEVLPFINALMDGGDDSQDLGWTAIQEIISALLKKGLLFRAMAILLVPEGEERFTPTTVEQRLEDMEDLSTAQIKEVMTGFFVGIGDSLSGTGIAFTPMKKADNLTETVSVTSKKKKATSQP